DLFPPPPSLFHYPPPLPPPPLAYSAKCLAPTSFHLFRSELQDLVSHHRVLLNPPPPPPPLRRTPSSVPLTVFPSSVGYGPSYARLRRAGRPDLTPESGDVAYATPVHERTQLAASAHGPGSAFGCSQDTERGRGLRRADVDGFGMGLEGRSLKLEAAPALLLAARCNESEETPPSFLIPHSSKSFAASATTTTTNLGSQASVNPVLVLRSSFCSALSTQHSAAAARAVGGVLSVFWGWPPPSNEPFSSQGLKPNPKLNLEDGSRALNPPSSISRTARGRGRAAAAGCPPCRPSVPGGSWELEVGSLRIAKDTFPSLATSSSLRTHIFVLLSLIT
ncbi:hypothetical protein CVT26_012800, partial [Gymnopilus dilepis]